MESIAWLIDRVRQGNCWDSRQEQTTPLDDDRRRKEGLLLIRICSWWSTRLAGSSLGPRGVLIDVFILLEIRGVLVDVFFLLGN